MRKCLYDKENVMDKKLIKRIVTIVMACASISTLAFVGCSKNPTMPVRAAAVVRILLILPTKPYR